MPRGGRPGQHLRGGKPGIDSSPATPDLHYFRQAGVAGEATGFEQETAYVWAKHTWETLAGGNYTHNSQSAGGVDDTDHLICLPQIFPRDATVAKLLYKSLSGIGAGLRIGIYSNRADGLVYPHRRLWQSAELGPTFLQSITLTPGLAVEGGSLLWLVLLADAATGAVETRGQFSNELVVLGGMPLTAWSTPDTWAAANVRPFVGWKIPQSYADGLPSEIGTDVGELNLPSHNASGAGYALPALGFTLTGMG